MFALITRGGCPFSDLIEAAAQHSLAKLQMLPVIFVTPDSVPEVVLQCEDLETALS